MIFEIDVSAGRSQIPSPAPILWITGLSGTGKSTLARAVMESLQADGLRPLLLDGDGLRDALEAGLANHDHSPAMRRLRAWRVARLARLAAGQGIPVVAATISLLHEVQAWNRSGPAPYAEVVLQADLAALRQRNPTLYCGAQPHVVGLDITPEYPLQPEIVLQQIFDPSGLRDHRESALRVWRRLWVAGCETP